MTTTVLRIRKLDAAAGQLDTAIKLYFQVGDPVAVHTLTCAAFNVLRDINAYNGFEPTYIKDKFLNCYNEEQRKEIRNVIYKPENFFKHANKDPEGIIQFTPMFTELLLMEACALYQRIAGNVSNEMIVFRMYGVLILKHPYELSQEIEELVKEVARSLAGTSRREFFAAGMEDIKHFRARKGN